MKTRRTTLKEWRERDYSALMEEMSSMVAELEELRSARNEEYDDLRAEIAEDLRDEYEEQMEELLRENRKWRLRCEELEALCTEKDEELERVHHDNATRMAALRDLMGVQMTNVQGNYIENSYGKNV